ncbi:hypothetical protein [Flavobacterium pedocola]
MKLNLALFSAINSFLVAQFLFFIDEGYYDFRWMEDAGNWLVFAVYFVVIFGMLILINAMLDKYKVSRTYQVAINLIIFPIILLIVNHYF